MSGGLPQQTFFSNIQFITRPDPFDAVDNCNPTCIGSAALADPEEAVVNFPSLSQLEINPDGPARPHGAARKQSFPGRLHVAWRVPVELLDVARLTL